MITSSDNRSWLGDIALGDASSAAGLPVLSSIRTAKIATVEVARVERLGRVGAETISAVDAILRRTLGLQGT